MPPVVYPVSTGPASPDDPGKVCAILLSFFIDPRSRTRSCCLRGVYCSSLRFACQGVSRNSFWLFSNSFFVFCQSLSLRPSPVRSFCTAEQDFTSPLTLCQGIFRANLETRFALLFARCCQTISFSEQRGVILLAAPRFVKGIGETRQGFHKVDAL